MPRCNSNLHVTGEATFVDDVEEPADLLHAAVFTSSDAHGTIRRFDASRARQLEGVEAVFTFSDIPGHEYLGPIIQDEPLFAVDEVSYSGQPLALVIARDTAVARKALALIEVSLDLLPIVTCPKVAHRQGQVLGATRVLKKGDVESAWSQCDFIVDGAVEVRGQEHVYLETNRARAIPGDAGQLQIYSSTQNPAGVQRAVAKTLGLPMHMVEVDVNRIGGGFGGKEDQATHWACMAALGAHRLKRPVQLVLSRSEDLRSTGNRHPYKQDYKLGLRRDGTILAYQIEHYQNSGAFMDLSSSVLGRTMLHSTGAYGIENVCVRATECRTNLPPNTAFRGFGAPQAMFALETAIHHAARRAGMAPEKIQEQNLIMDGYKFAYGQSIQKSVLRDSWNKSKTTFRLSEIRQRIDDFNENHLGRKMGFALMPVCFGIGFTNTFLNQGSSLVHVYTDGSVSVATGGIEMGQGIHSNLIAITADTLGIAPDRVRVTSTNTTRIANSSASAASSSTELNGHATIDACHRILRRIKSVAATMLASDGRQVSADQITIADDTFFADGTPTELTWNDVVLQTYKSRHSLMAHGYHAPTGITFDPDSTTGNLFLYYSCGTSLIEVTVDCLRGTYTIDSVKLIHDVGRPIIPDIDLGQIEGALAQGIGLVTLEEVVYDERGTLASDSLSTYKVPNADFLPEQMDVQFIENFDVRRSPLKSKAVGEPPLMYGIAAYFAIQKAIDAFHAQQNRHGVDTKPTYSPMTPERVLMSLYQPVDASRIHHRAPRRSPAVASLRRAADQTNPSNPTSKDTF